MKLRIKFSLIVALTVFQVGMLSFVTIISSNRLQSIEHYRFIQSETQKDLSELIEFLDKIDSWGIGITTVSRDWNQYTSDLDKNIHYLSSAPITKKFGKDFQENIKQTENLWGLFSNRFAPIEEILKDINSVKIPLGDSTHTEKDGIRAAYALYPQNVKFKQLYDDVEQLHTHIKGLRRSYETLSGIARKNSIILTTYIEKYKTLFIIEAVFLAVISCAILAFLISIVTNGVSKRIIKIRDMSSVLAQKDFTASLTPEGSTEMYSLMSNINEMVTQINNFFVIVKTAATKAISSGYSINDSANSTAAASSEIDRNVDQINLQFNQISEAVSNTVAAISEMNVHVETLVENNSKQSAAIEESNNAVNEIVGTLGSISDMAKARAENAEEMSSLVADGDEKMASTVEILRQITQQLDEVQEVVTIIDSVAEQTNLLSMNAAIESAHAGEAGKGFAVVAEEIRGLAEETSENANRIKDVISKIVEYVQNADTTSNNAAEAFSKVSEHTGSVITSFRDITDDIEKIDIQMQQIKFQSQETASTAEEINKYCGDLSDRQKVVSSEVNTMNELFGQAAKSLHDIKTGTSDIVKRMKEVSGASKESFKNMTDLENTLELFKTKEEVNEAVAKADEENQITKVVSSELENISSSEISEIGQNVDLDEFLN